MRCDYASIAPLGRDIFTGRAMAFFQLRYISTRAAADIAKHVPGILETARRRNQANGVTGLLIFNGERFLQLLEGPERAVRETFERIGRDPRHLGVAVLGTAISPERAFREWDMAYEELTGAVAQFDSLEEQVAALVANAPAHIAREFVAYASLARPLRRA